MAKLDKLIEELCPEGVEYVKLGDCCEFQNGFAFKSNLFKNKGLPILRITNFNDGKLSNDGYVYFDKNDYKENLDQYKIPINSIIIAMSGATTGKIGYNDLKNEYYLNQRVGKFIPKEGYLNNRFLYHWINGQSKNILNISIGTGTQPNLSSRKLMELLIPLPPLPVQEEIVKILDNFTELTAELTARKSQYEYYRDKLLTFGDEVEWKSLGEVGVIVRGASPRPISKYITNDENGVNWIKIGDVSVSDKYITSTREKITKEGSKKSRFVYPGDFILSNSMSFGRPYIMSIEGCIHDGWLSISKFEDSFIPDFLYYLLNSRFIQNEMEKKASSGTVKNLNASIVRSLSVPIPPLAEQERIVSILDKFDTLTNDISIGLPAEIEARKKQYEYYREKLLTFKEKVK